MAYQITHIRMSQSTTSTEHITRVKLADGTEETREQVVKYIDQNMEYFYTKSSGYKAIVESVHPSGRPAYIRTKGDSTTADNLLSLPRF